MKYVRKTRKPRKYNKKSKLYANVRTKTQVQAGKGFPQKMTMTHKFVHSGTLTSVVGSGGFGTETIFVNGMFKPINSAVTHQPLYFDQMTVLYRYYTIIGSKVRVKFVDSGAGGIGTFVVIFPNDTVVAQVPLLMSSLIEQNKATYGILDGAGQVAVKNLSLNWSAKKSYGGSVLGNDELRGSNLVNPVESPSFVIACQSLDTTLTSTVRYVIEVEYIAVWTVLRDVFGS